MSYDDAFYIKYAEYLEEPTVRRNHNRVLNTFRTWFGGGEMRVIDLGCGAGEFQSDCPAVDVYLGIDKESSPACHVEWDYTRPLPLLPFVPNAFVSLFSIEACLPWYGRYAIYNRMFNTYPIQKALVSGFYYEHAAKDDTVSESGDLISFQTIQPIERYQSRVFDETRIVMRTPSEFFGRDVVEVWKILERKVK